MTTVPTPSDSQDGARRRDNAEPLSLDQAVDKIKRLGETILWFDQQRELLFAQVNGLRADVARLEAERDEARADANRRLANLQTATRERDEARMALDTMRVLRDEWMRRFNQHAGAENATIEAMRPVYDAAVAWAEAVKNPNDPEPWDAAPRSHALVAAVDQTAPSSPLETPQAADGGEAGVVEGAGGSEAAEGEQCASDGPHGRCTHPAGHEGNCHVAFRLKRREIPGEAPRRPEGRTPLSRERAAALVGSNTRVRVWLNYAGPGDEGVVIGYLDRPSLIIQRPDGSQSSWSIDLDYEELDTDA